jgi:hypothetical protein
VTENIPQIYTDRDIAKAKRSAKVVGFVQGGLAVFVVGLMLKFVSWVPIVLGASLVGYVGYKLLTREKKGKGERDPSAPNMRTS